MKKNQPKTELLYKKSIPIDKLKMSEGIKLIAKEQKDAASEVQKSITSIGLAINKIFNHLHLHKNGRLIYVGAGTSGRIGIQDGVELYPTFNWPKDRLDFIIAGGHSAILNSIEDAEDDIIAARKQVLEKSINYKDVVIGLAASGNTPFTCKVMEDCYNKKALTVSISNNPNGKLLTFGDVKIILDTKEEVIAGSTRLKAGTAQKICLNIISSMVMVRMGKVENGLMRNLVATNAKLRKRKENIDLNTHNQV